MKKQLLNNADNVNLANNDAIEVILRGVWKEHLIKIEETDIISSSKFMLTEDFNITITSNANFPVIRLEPRGLDRTCDVTFNNGIRAKVRITFSILGSFLLNFCEPFE